MKKKQLPYFVFLLSISFLLACAQVVSPSGGEKDVTPPEVISLEPKNESTNFDVKTIEIEFNEFVKLNQINEQLIISPPLKYKPKTTIKGKRLLIEIKDTLSENKTYVMNFGNSIVDITENNPIPDFKYVFSTGETIDSLELNGLVLDAFDLQAEEKFLVMLYEEVNQDSIPMKSLPTYVSRTDKEGQFNIGNIAAGNYKVFTLKDGNANYLFDQPTEKIGFLLEPIQLPYEKEEKIILYSFEEEAIKQFVENKSMENNQLLLDFKKATKKLSFSLLDSNIEDLLLHYHLSKGRDSATFWFKEITKQRRSLIIHDDSSYRDTIELKLDSIPPKNRLKLQSSLTAKQNFFQDLKLTFNRPLLAIDTSLIAVRKADSSQIDFSISIDSTDKHHARLNFEIKEDSTYLLQLFPNSFTDIYGRTLNDSISERVSFNKADQFSNLEVKVTSEADSSSLIIQLTDSKGKALREKKLIEYQAKFNYITAGKYRLKLIYDENNNGKWDTGDYLKKRQAEKTFLYDEDIEIRSNWDKEIEWIIQ